MRLAARKPAARKWNFCVPVGVFLCRTTAVGAQEGAMSKPAIGIAVLVLATLLSGAAIGKGGGGMAVAEATVAGTAAATGILAGIMAAGILAAATTAWRSRIPSFSRAPFAAIAPLPARRSEFRPDPKAPVGRKLPQRDELAVARRRLAQRAHCSAIPAARAQIAAGLAMAGWHSGRGAKRVVAARQWRIWLGRPAVLAVRLLRHL